MATVSISEAIEVFRNAAMEAGVELPASILADATLHRFPTNGTGSDDAGWYILYGNNNPAGRFGCWRQGIDQVWCYKNGRELSPAEHAEQKRRLEEAKRLSDEQRAKDMAEAKERAERTWNAAKPAPDDHAYLKRKRIQSHGTRLHDGNVIVPLFDESGDFHSLQSIDASGNKRFTIRGRTSGLYFSIGEHIDRFVFAEGFATAASIHEATGDTAVVCFYAKNMTSVVSTLRKQYPGAAFLIAADNDPTGIEAANEAARLNDARVVFPPGAGDDFNDVAVSQGPDAVAAIINGETIAPEPPEKRPLRREIEPPLKFPVEALGDVLSPMVGAIQHATQAPMALCGTSVLCAAAVCTQAFADVEIDGRRYPISIMAVALAASGERKSEVDRLALGPVYRRQEQLSESFEREIEQYEIASAVYKKAKQDAMSGTKKSLHERSEAVKEIGPPPQRPLEPILLCTEPTYEGLVKLFINGQPSMGLFSDEGGAFIGGHGMSGDQQIKTAAGLCDLHGGKAISRVRAVDGAKLLFHRRLSIYLMAQPEVAAILLNNPMLSKQGLLARMLITWPESTIGTRLYRTVDVLKDPAVIEYYEVISRILETPFPTAEDNPKELQPRILTLNDEAKATWITHHDEIEQELKNGKLSSIRAHGAKAAENILRVAAVLALIRDFERDYIDEQCVLDAADLIQFYLNEASRLESAQLVDPEIANAEQVTEWCRDNNKDIVTAVELYQYGPNSIRTADQVKAVMPILEDHGWAEILPEGAEFKGQRRKDAWRMYV